MDKALSKPLTIPYTDSKCESDILDGRFWKHEWAARVQIALDEMMDADILQNELILVAANA